MKGIIIVILLVVLYGYVGNVDYNEMVNHQEACHAPWAE